jgi:hypothetical protein
VEVIERHEEGIRGLVKNYHFDPDWVTKSEHISFKSKTYTLIPVINFSKLPFEDRHIWISSSQRPKELLLELLST